MGKCCPSDVLAGLEKMLRKNHMVGGETIIGPLIDYSWPLNNMGLSYVGPLICKFFSINPYYTTTRSVAGWICEYGETVDMEGRL